MKINKSSNRKVVVFVALGAILLAFAYTAGAYMYKWYPFHPKSESAQEQVNSVNYDEPTKEQQNAPTEMTQEGSKNIPTKSEKDTVTIAITSSQVDPSGALRIGTVIQALVSSGECTLTVKKNGQEIDVQKASVQAMSNSSTCKGFTVPAGKLSSGTYTINISYVNGANKGNASTEVIVP